MCGCIIIVDEPEDQPIIVSRAEYAQQECYLLTPFRRGSSAMEGDPWDNLPAAGNNTLPIYTTITNKELKVGKINDINIKVVDVWLKDVNEGNITVKINNDIIGTVPVTNGSATVQYSPQEEANYTIVLDYQTNTENYVQYDWIGDHSGGGMCRFKPCNDSLIIDAVIPITTIIIEPTVAQINDTISISASVTSDNTPITGGRVIFKVRRCV